VSLAVTEKRFRERLNDPKFAEIQPRAIVNAFRRELQKAPSHIRHRIAGINPNGALSDYFERHQTDSEGPFVTALLLSLSKDWMDGTVILPSGERHQILVCEQDCELWFEDEVGAYVSRHLRQQKTPSVPRHATGAVVTVAEDIPPEWVPWFELLRWVIWIAHHYHGIDEGRARHLIPHVVVALRHKVDERVEPRLGLWDQHDQDHGQFVGEILWISHYHVDWKTGWTQRVHHLEEDPLHLRNRRFVVAAAWDWLVAAVKQAVEQIPALHAVALPASPKTPAEGAGASPMSAPEPSPLASAMDALDSGDHQSEAATTTPDPTAQTPGPSRKLPAANDDQIHACIEALHREREAGEAPLNREKLYKRAPKWLAREHGVWAPQKALRRCFGENRHKNKRREPGEH
jgi:hypothetical protein